jgi:hypothetical protein
MARATSESVPHEPPTTMTASAALTMTAFRAWPIPVGITMDRSGFAPSLSARDSTPTTVPSSDRAPAATAAMTPP